MKNLNQYSDDALLRLVAQDDENAFEALFDRYWEMAHCLAFSKLKSKEVTQEIVNDLFLNFWQRRHSLRINNFEHYLKVAIKYKAITHINQQLSQRRNYDSYRNQVPIREEQTLREVEYNELMRALEHGIKILPERTQEVFRMNRLEGRSVSEIANHLNLSEKAIEYHITRSRKELRLHLKDFLMLICICASYPL